MTQEVEKEAKKIFRNYPFISTGDLYQMLSCAGYSIPIKVIEDWLNEWKKNPISKEVRPIENL